MSLIFPPSINNGDKKRGILPSFEIFIKNF